MHGAIQRGDSQVRGKKRGVGAVWRQHPLLSSKKKSPSSSLKSISELRWTPGLSLALLQLSSDLGETFPWNGGEQPGPWPDHTLASGGQRRCPWADCAQLRADSSASATERGPGSDQPSQSSRGPGQDLWSHFLSHLGCFPLHWRLAIPPQPVPALTSCSGCFPTDTAMRHWIAGCHLDRPEKLQPQIRRSWAKETFSPQIKKQNRRN